MKNCKMINRIVLIIIIFVAIASPKTVKAQVSLTLEEQDYIKERNIIKADSALYEVKKKGGDQIGFYK